LLAAHRALAAVISSGSGFAGLICIRLLERKESRTERLLRKHQREVKAVTERISAYVWNMHKRSPTREVLVGEKDLAEQRWKRPGTVATALNMLLGERKVQKTSLAGYWKLNVEKDQPKGGTISQCSVFKLVDLLPAINEKPQTVRPWGSVEQPSPEVCS
jgi:hypothetical protein